MSWEKTLHALREVTVLGTRAGSRSGPHVAEIRDVIERQLTAFRQDDAQAAFELASEGVRARFADPEAFLGMVRSTYRPLYRPRAWVYGEVVETRRGLGQLVALIGEDGTPSTALYLVERTGGAWWTAGCLLFEPAGSPG